MAPKVTDAVKRSFTTSITQIYVYAFWLSLVALAAIVFWLPEIPLSKGAPAEVAPVFE